MKTLRDLACRALGLSATASQADLYRAALVRSATIRAMATPSYGPRTPKDKEFNVVFDDNTMRTWLTAEEAVRLARAYHGTAVVDRNGQPMMEFVNGKMTDKFKSRSGW